MVEKLLMYADIRIDVNTFLGFVLFYSLGLGFVVSYLFNVVLGFSPALIFLLVFLFIHIGTYIWLVLSADARARLAEQVLPDALQLMSANIRSGLTVDKALFLAARPEFGPLKAEIELAAKEMMTGKTLEDALEGISKRIRSKNLEITIDLVVQGLHSGGVLTESLDRIADVLRNREFVQKEIRANILMYLTFIFFAVGVGGPALYAISSFLAQMLSENMKLLMHNIPSGKSSLGFGMGFAMSTVPISPSFLVHFSLASIISSCILGSFALGLISKGKTKEGFKYIIPLIILALTVFFSIRFILFHLLGSMFFS